MNRRSAQPEPRASAPQGAARTSEGSYPPPARQARLDEAGAFPARAARTSAAFLAQLAGARLAGTRLAAARGAAPTIHRAYLAHGPADMAPGLLCDLKI